MSVAAAWLDQATTALGERRPHPGAHPVALLAHADRLIAHQVATGQLRRVVHPEPVTLPHPDGTVTTIGRGEIAVVIGDDGPGVLVVVRP